MTHNWKQHKDWANALADERGRIRDRFRYRIAEQVCALIHMNRWEEAAKSLRAWADEFETVSRTTATAHAQSLKG